MCAGETLPLKFENSNNLYEKRPENGKLEFCKCIKRKKHLICSGDSSIIGVLKSFQNYVVEALTSNVSLTKTLIN